MNKKLLAALVAILVINSNTNTMAPLKNAGRDALVMVLARFRPQINKITTSLAIRGAGLEASDEERLALKKFKSNNSYSDLRTGVCKQALESLKEDVKVADKAGRRKMMRTIAEDKKGIAVKAKRAAWEVAKNDAIAPIINDHLRANPVQSFGRKTAAEKAESARVQGLVLPLLVEVDAKFEKTPVSKFWPARGEWPF